MAELPSVPALRQDLSIEEIMERLRRQLPELTVRYEIRSLGIFGSYVHGNADQDSDLDILVDFRTPPTLFQFVRLQDELSGLLGVPVDLVMKTSLRPRIGEQILADVIPV